MPVGGDESSVEIRLLRQGMNEDCMHVEEAPRTRSWQAESGSSMPTDKDESSIAYTGPCGAWDQHLKARGDPNHIPQP